MPAAYSLSIEYELISIARAYSMSRVRDTCRADSLKIMVLSVEVDCLAVGGGADLLLN